MQEWMCDLIGLNACHREKTLADWMSGDRSSSMGMERRIEAGVFLGASDCDE